MFTPPQDPLASLDAEYYQQNSSVQLSLAEQAMSLLKLQGDEYILDIGCGDGRVTHELAKKARRGKSKESIYLLR